MRLSTEIALHCYCMERDLKRSIHASKNSTGYSEGKKSYRSTKLRTRTRCGSAQRSRSIAIVWSAISREVFTRPRTVQDILKGKSPIEVRNYEHVLDAAQHRDRAPLLLYGARSQEKYSRVQEQYRIF